MPATMNFSMRLVRPAFAFAADQRSKDDVVTIKPAEGGQYSLIYLYRNAGQRQRSEQTLGAADLFRWTRTTLGLLELDSDPFAALQVTVTGVPSVLIGVDQLRANENRGYHAVMDALEFFVDYTQGTQRSLPSTLSDSKFSAYLIRDGEAEEDELIRVQAAPNGEYVVTNKESMDRADGPVSQLVLTRAGVEQWMRLILNFFRVDGDPCNHMQLSVTGFPDFLLPVAEITGTHKLISYKIGDSTGRVLDMLEFFLDTVEEPEEEFIPVPREPTGPLSEVAEDDQEAAESEEETEEEDDLSSESYSTDSEDEYADMPPLISAKQALMEDYAAYRYSTWAQKNNHLFFDSDGDVIMGR